MRPTRRRGFTLVELMLALSFLSFIMIFVSLSVVQMLRIYDRGLAIKEIDQTGTSLVNDLSRLVRASANTQDVISINADKGVVCIGTTAYVWNPLYKADKTLNTANRFSFSSEPVTLARWEVTNPTAPTSICNTPGPIPTRAKDSDNYQLISGRARVLDAHVTRSSDKKLIKITFHLGTYDSSELVALGGTPAPSPAGVYNTAYYPNNLAADPTCPAGDVGTYCFVTTFTSTIYLPNALQ